VQNAVRLIVAVAVSAACFVFATRGTDWSDVGARVREAHLGWALAVAAVSCGCHVLRAERWRVLLRPVGAVPRGPAIAATFIGFGSSMVLPFRLGEIVRPAVLGRRVGIPTSAALSSVVLERLFDILLVVCCFFVVGLVYDVPAYLRAGAFTLGIGTAIGFVLLVMMARNRAGATRVLRRLVDVLPARVGDLVWPVLDGLLQGLGGLAQLSTILLVLGYSAILWTAIMFTYLFSFLALDVPVPLVAASLTTVVVVAAFVFLPQAPGFVGTWQAGCVLALGLFHVAQDPAVTYSLLTWVIQLVVNVGGALVFMAFQDLSVRQLVAAAEEQP
jgi:glycosyltransferase 2 family protein